MWVFTESGYLSIVAHTEWRDKLLVRARVRRDLEIFLQRAGVPLDEICSTPEADYGFRAVVDRCVVARTMAELIGTIQYPNFKGRIQQTQGQARLRTYHEIWEVLHDLE